MMAQSSEFGQMAIREEELPELDTLARDACHFDIKGGPENKHGKVNILLQASAATRLLHVCCTFDYQPGLFACCWADVAPTKRWNALLLLAFPCLWSSAVPSFWVSNLQQCKSAHGAASIRLLCLPAYVTSSCCVLHTAFRELSCLLPHHQCCKPLLL